ncbi:sulfite exporter TauE/SafE family protein [Allohahella marinimesophila]|uniref:Probable membrane transporter protein n=1 Tax=Allohahella marinimesophila TaxID=1054972 RepID=A0ABP7NI73_9GAMM
MEFFPWAVTAAILLVGCWVQTALGFGMAVIAAPVVVMVEPEWVPVVLTITALNLSLLNSWNQRTAIEMHQLRIPFITRIPGTILGTWLLLQLNAFWLQIFVASTVLLAVLISFKGPQFQYTPARLGVAAFVSGITGTTTSIGGPPMALVMQHGAPMTVRANLSVFFVYSCALSLIGYWLADILTLELLLVSLTFVPFCLLGFFTGKQARPYVDAGRFRPLLLVICGFAGAFALVGTLSRA